MTREEALNLYWNVSYQMSNSRQKKAVDMAFDALREQPQWISVEERLPEERGSYLTSCKFYGYISVLEWDGCYDGIAEELHGRALWYDHDSEWGTYEVDCVTHWMPLPEPPKEGV